jgi:hypothetical protein
MAVPDFKPILSILELNSTNTEKQTNWMLEAFA